MQSVRGNCLFRLLKYLGRSLHLILFTCFWIIINSVTNNYIYIYIFHSVLPAWLVLIGLTQHCLLLSPPPLLVFAGRVWRRWTKGKGKSWIATYYSSSAFVMRSAFSRSASILSGGFWLVWTERHKWAEGKATQGSDTVNSLLMSFRRKPLWLPPHSSQELLCQRRVKPANRLVPPRDPLAHLPKALVGAGGLLASFPMWPCGPRHGILGF